MDCNVNYNKLFFIIIIINYNKLFNRFREVLSKEIAKHTVTVNKHTNLVCLMHQPVLGLISFCLHCADQMSANGYKKRQQSPQGKSFKGPMNESFVAFT